jgi:hypothetical protein
MPRRFIPFAMPGDDEPGNINDTALHRTAADASDGGYPLDIQKLPIAAGQTSLGAHLQGDGHEADFPAAGNVNVFFHLNSRNKVFSFYPDQPLWANQIFARGCGAAR